jgi:hypothetical protein
MENKLEALRIKRDSAYLYSELLEIPLLQFIICFFASRTVRSSITRIPIHFSLAASRH